MRSAARTTLLSLALPLVAAACAPDAILQPPPATPSGLAPRAPSASGALGSATDLPAIAAIDLRNACYIRVDGAMGCAGLTAVLAPRMPNTGRFVGLTARVVSFQSMYACGVRTDGAAECFRFGTDPVLATLAPDVRVPGAGRFVRLASGGLAGVGHFVCGLRDDGRVECWGVGIDPALAGVRSGTGSAFIDVTAGRTYACGARADGAVECWGNLTPDRIPAVYQPPSGHAIMRVAAAGSPVCFLSSDGRIDCVGAVVEAGVMPGHVETPAGYVEIQGGASGAVCARRSTGEIDCFGSQPPAFGGGAFRAMSQMGESNQGCALRLAPIAGTPLSHSEALCSPSILNIYVGEMVLRSPQTVAFTTIPKSPARAQTSYAAAATASSGLPVDITSLTPSVCATNGSGQVSLLTTGTCTLAANQPGLGIEWLAAPQVTQSFAVDVAAVQIALGALAHVYDGQPKSATTATTPSGVPVVVTYTVGGVPTTAPPTAPGSYPISASPLDPAAWWGSRTGTLVIEMPRLAIAPSTISLKSTATVTAYVYGSAIVDASAVSPASVRLRIAGSASAGAPVATRNGLAMTTVRDFDGDGRLDRQLIFNTTDLVAAGLTTTAKSMVLEDQTGSYRFRATPVAAPAVVP